MSVLATDSFTRADAATLGANWATAKGATASLQVKSNQAAADATGGNRNGNYYTGVVWPNDQYSQATVLTGAIATVDAGPAIRMITTGATRTMYVGGYLRNTFGDALPHVYKEVASAFTSLGAGSGNIVANDVCYLEAQGTTLVLKINGTTKVTATDSSIASGSAGIWTDSGAANTALLDDWSGGNFASSFQAAWATSANHLIAGGVGG